MPLWKLMLLRAYYAAMSPYHAWHRRQALAAGRMPIVVLFYHRVADDHATDWTTPTRAFTRQLRWLQEHCELVTLDEVQRRLRSGENHRRCVSITFDDGYAENGQFAIPMLVSRRIPFTYMVTVRNMLAGKPFQHDQARGNSFPPNCISEVRALADLGVEIGCHSFSHQDLGAVHSRRQMQREVVDAKYMLEDALGRPVRYFSFPFGLPANMPTSAFVMAREAGYQGVCSAYGAYNLPGDPAFHLHRVHADRDMLRFKAWINFSPRKLKIPRWTWEEETRPTATAGLPVDIGPMPPGTMLQETLG